MAVSPHVNSIVRVRGKKTMTEGVPVGTARQTETRLSCGEAWVAQGARGGRRNSENNQIARGHWGGGKAASSCASTKVVVLKTT